MEFPTKATLKNAATSWRLWWGSFVLVGSSWIMLICLYCLSLHFIFIIKWCKVHSKADIDLSYANSIGTEAKKRSINTLWIQGFRAQQMCCSELSGLWSVFRAFPSCSLSSNTVTLLLLQPLKGSYAMLCVILESTFGLVLKTSVSSCTAAKVIDPKLQCSLACSSRSQGSFYGLAEISQLASKGYCNYRQ